MPPKAVQEFFPRNTFKNNFTTFRREPQKPL
jgi:hypothetical protein